MHSAATPLSSSSAAEFADGLGVRLKMADATVPEPLEILRLRSEFLASPSFEFMLRERVSRLANFRHAYYSRVRRVDRLDSGSLLGIVSESPQGPRLSRILEVAHACQIDLDVNAALCLVRQLVPAVAMLHQNARDVSHGALSPERIVVTSNARVVIVEYVLGAAIEQLAYSRERLWKELRIAVPSGAGVSRLNHRADVMQLGMVALALVLGRPLWDDDLKSLSALVASATESSVMGGRASISEPLRRWLSRSLQLDSRCVVRVRARSAACAGRCAVGRGRLHRRSNRARVVPGPVRGMRGDNTGARGATRGRRTRRVPRATGQQTSLGITRACQCGECRASPARRTGRA